MGAPLPRFLSSCISKLPETLLSPQDKVKIVDSEHCSRAELLATHVKRLETLHSTS